MSEHRDGMASRRAFVGGSAGLLAASAVSGATDGARPPLGVALVGCGSNGSRHLAALLARNDVTVAWVCDVDSQRLASAREKVVAAGRPEPRATGDLREPLADRGVGAVWISTPDHWHAAAAILSADEGKHVYVEKPCSHNVREGRLMIDAARRNAITMQVGTQMRSSPCILRAIEALRGGEVGDVLAAKAWNSQRRRSIGRGAPAEPPASLRYDDWVGPAAWQPYRTNLLHASWRFWKAFGTGDIGNDGVHEMDIARLGLGVAAHPDRVTGLGGLLWFDDDREFPDTQTCVYQWTGAGPAGRGLQLVYEQRDWSPYVQEGHENGVAFYGTKGMLLLGKQRWQLFGERNKLLREDEGPLELQPHHDDFLACIRAGGRPRADIEEGHMSATLAHLGNVACAVGRTLRFDPRGETILDDPDAAAMLRRDYRRGHWAAPRDG